MSLMVNPFRKSFVTGISELTRFGLTAPIGADPKDERIPIGPGDNMSMQRERAGIAQPERVVQNQPMVDALDVLVIRPSKKAVGKFSRLGKQCIAFIFSHAGIVRRMQGRDHSRFPVVVFVHGCNVSAAGA